MQEPEPGPCRTVNARADFRVADYLHAVDGHLPTALVSAQSRQSITDLASCLPGAMTSFFGFECVLGADRGGADFLLCSTPEEGHVGVIAGRDPDACLAPDLLAAPAWQRVVDFCAAWLVPGSPLSRGLMNLWLEFDTAARADALHNPSLFFGVHAPADDATPVIQGAAVDAALAELAGAGLHGPRDTLLRATLAALPPGCYAFQLGLMWSRECPTLRVCLRQLPVADVSTLLARLDWPGATAALQDCLAALAPRAARIDVDLDLAATVSPKIGLECYFGTDRLANERLRAFTRYLLEQHLCTAAEADALCAYAGLTVPRTSGRPWPAYLHDRARAAGDGVASCLSRWVHHVKLVLAPETAPLAKAYLAVEHHLVDEHRLRGAITAARSAP